MSDSFAIIRNWGIGALTPLYFASRYIGGSIDDFEAKQDFTTMNIFRLIQLGLLALSALILALVVKSFVDDTRKGVVPTKLENYWFIGLLTTFIVVSFIYPIFIGTEAKWVKKGRSDVRRTIKIR